MEEHQGHCSIHVRTPPKKKGLEEEVEAGKFNLLCFCEMVKERKNESYCNPAMSICEKSILLVEQLSRTGVAVPLVLLLKGVEEGGGCLMPRTLQFNLFAMLLLPWAITNLCQLPNEKYINKFYFKLIRKNYLCVQKT